MPLANCAAYLAARIGDDRLSHPVAVWENRETGELRLEPDVRELHEVHDLCMVQMLHVLRTGAVTALLPGRKAALPADFWQWPEATECVRTGLWQGKQLLVARVEMDDVVKAVSAALQEPIEPADESQTSTGATRKHTLKAERNCLDYLKELMSSGSDPEPREAVKQRCLENFGPGLSGRAFSRAWGTAVGETDAVSWSRPGRKRATKSNRDAVAAKS